jgi:hypothetical protein
MRTARLAGLLLLVTAMPGAGLFAQPAPPAPKEEAALGFKLGAVPDVLYSHLPILEPGQGLIVESIKPGSRAAELGLKTYDIVLAVGATPVRNSPDLCGRVLTLPATEREVLQIIRGGKQFALTVGPHQAPEAAYSPPKSLFKPGGPPAVGVEVKPLPAGAMEINLFYLNLSGKMERQALSGSLEDIERQAEDLAVTGRMPEPIHDLVSLALKRLRAKNSTPNSK